MISLVRLGSCAPLEKGGGSASFQSQGLDWRRNVPLKRIEVQLTLEQMNASWQHVVTFVVSPFIFSHPQATIFFVFMYSGPIPNYLSEPWFCVQAVYVCVCGGDRGGIQAGCTERGGVGVQGHPCFCTVIRTQRTNRSGFRNCVI